MKFKYSCGLLLTLLINAVSNAQTSIDEEDLGPIQELEAFIVRESSAYQSGAITPSSRPVTGIFTGDMSVLEMPRSVTMVTPTHMELLDIDDLRSLSKFGAGTQIINHYGVTGTPIIRGAKGATLLNGMVRSFNLNEMPLSFGSSEALDIVKGPTPPHISPTHVGGFVNMVPKAPFFDERRGSLSLSVGSYDHYRAQLDYGGPVMMFGKPSAFRVSATFQREDGYYDRLKNDFESIYVAIKTDLNKKVTAFGGFEFFHFESNENAGWNRPTQALVDNGNYVIGEPINITDSDFQNTGNRDLASFPFGYGWANGIQDFNALVVPTAVVDDAVNNGMISDAARKAMLDLSNPDDLARAYGQPLPSTGEHDPLYQADAPVADTLARLSGNPNEGYRYTRAYFDQGGVVFTTPIEGNQILSDEEDKSEATNWVGFLDLDWTGGKNTHWQNKTLIDALKTEKLSSYGYAIDTEQFVFANKTQGQNHLDFGSNTWISYGVGLRYTSAEMVQDYFAEPFSRRDISRNEVSSNSKILAGPQIGPDGLNYWSPDIGANVKSKLFQTGAFAQLDSDLNSRLRIMLSARAEQAWYDAELPSRVQRASDDIRESLNQNGEKSLYSLGAYITYRVSDAIRLYAAVQDGIALDLTQAGGVFGEENFAKSKLIEGGVKARAIDDRIEASLSIWEWEQSRFNQRDFQSEPLEGKGVEFEATITLIQDDLYLIASAENQRIRRLSGLGFRSLPQSEQDWALNAGVLNGGVDAFPENNPELNYPGIPETTYKTHLIWTPGTYSFSASGIYGRAHWLNFEQTIKLPDSLQIQLHASRTFGDWQVSVGVENLTDEDYFLGADPLFASNTLVTKGLPRTYRFTLKKSF